MCQVPIFTYISPKGNLVAFANWFLVFLLRCGDVEPHPGPRCRKKKRKLILSPSKNPRCMTMSLLPFPNVHGNMGTQLRCQQVLRRATDGVNRVVKMESSR
jgi:hypothetical protein